MWLVYYFIANLGLTLCERMRFFPMRSVLIHEADNKLVLVKFPFPWTLTACHTLCGCIGSAILLQQGVFVQSRLTRRESLVLLAFSILYTMSVLSYVKHIEVLTISLSNIAVSNLSLHLVTVPVSVAMTDYSTSLSAG